MQWGFPLLSMPIQIRRARVQWSYRVKKRSWNHRLTHTNLRFNNIIITWPFLVFCTMALPQCQCVRTCIASIGTCGQVLYVIIYMHLSMCRPTPPPPLGWVGLTWGIWPYPVPQIKFPLPGRGGFFVQIPPVNTGGFELQAICTQSLLRKARGQVKSPSMGPTFQVEFPCMSWGGGGGATHW